MNGLGCFFEYFLFHRFWPGALAIPGYASACNPSSHYPSSPSPLSSSPSAFCFWFPASSGSPSSSPRCSCHRHSGAIKPHLSSASPLPRARMSQSEAASDACKPTHFHRPSPRSDERSCFVRRCSGLRTPRPQPVVPRRRALRRQLLCHLALPERPRHAKSTCSASSPHTSGLLCLLAASSTSAYEHSGSPPSTLSCC
jgi:hypothetical protein